MNKPPASNSFTGATTLREHVQEAEAKGFDHVDTWVFDLDNTLYPASSRLFDQIDAKITAYVMQRSGLDGLSARALQKYYYRRHGTTLAGMMSEDGLDPHHFLAFVHDIDHAVLAPAPDLAAAIARLPGRRFVLTNGSRRHAESVIARLGISELFEDIFDIAAASFVPKPDAAAYDAFLKLHGIEPSKAAMFEDLSKNLVVPHRLGMRTVLVTPRDGEPEGLERLTSATDAHGGPHVDHMTDDLAGFLSALALVAAD
ncbi:pyrimidine 5'-nucleotidase [Chenggangzhangella methanolivorans]|uniref:Pyrimidine 5'-nucleotidase n=1 Tax=Chenggangzhangella methanolivorans TaxID=1437009 RepID=A0A9E6ULX2_9HYPH|nr:pyrimidine 5'-nucleotidase [Chenggangzhangella methanolivorans]QZO01037.1 pyrimidine 5'-nucleotidase [Chenggangzhangella methanolivorans]